MFCENTGVLALSRVYDPRVVRIAAYLAMLFSFSPKFAMIIQAMPSGIVGGISFMLYGMIAAIGVRNVVEAQVDFKKSRNVIVAAIIVVCALGIKFSSGMGADVLSGVDRSAMSRELKKMKDEGLIQTNKGIVTINR